MNSTRSEGAPARQFKTGRKRSARFARIRPGNHQVPIAAQWGHIPAGIVYPGFGRWLHELASTGDKRHVASPMQPAHCAQFGQSGGEDHGSHNTPQREAGAAGTRGLAGVGSVRHPTATLRLPTRFMVGRVRERVRQWTAQGPSAAGIPRSHGSLEKIDVIPGILAVPTHDEDGDKIAFAKKALFRVLRKLPLTDDADRWPSSESASTIVTEFEPILPTPTVRWTDTTSDRAMTLIAFQGLGAHRLEPLEADPDGAAYAVDVSWMQAFPVRPGLEPYGACAYFAADGTLRRVYTSHDDRTHYSGDPSWEEAKWRWRCTLFAAVTIADHLGATHFLTSNLLVTVTREQLPADHPLRRFLKPYGYGAIDRLRIPSSSRLVCRSIISLSEPMKSAISGP
jgi:hypothetical protein